MSPHQQRRRRFDTVSFTESDEGNAMSAPGGYAITHVFQMQSDEETNQGQYTHTVAVEDWTEVAPAIEFLMTFPEGAGYTVSLDVRSRNAMEPEQEPEPVNPWKRYSASARVFVTARNADDAAAIVSRYETPLAMLDLGAHNLCVYPAFDTPVCDSDDAIVPEHDDVTDQDVCRRCFLPYGSAGDGYDGLCPSCADEADAS